MNAEIRKDLTLKFRIDDQTRFNKSDWYLFFDSLDTPAEPTERMKKAAQRYNQIVNSDGV